VYSKKGYAINRTAESLVHSAFYILVTMALWYRDG